MQRILRSVFILIVIISLAGLAFAGPRINEAFRTIFKQSESSIHISEQVIEKSRQIKMTSEKLHELTGPNHKHNKDLKKVRKESEGLQRQLKELKGLVADLDSPITTIENETNKLRARKCPPGYYWVPGYTTADGRHIEGNCRPN